MVAIVRILSLFLVLILMSSLIACEKSPVPKKIQDDGIIVVKDQEGNVLYRVYGYPDYFLTDEEYEYIEVPTESTRDFRTFQKVRKSRQGTFSK